MHKNPHKMMHRRAKSNTIIRSILSSNTIIIALITTIATSSILHAQPPAEHPYEVKIATAEAEMRKGEYYNALDWYNRAYSEQRNPELALKIAELHLALRDYKKAAIWYKRVLRRDKKNRYAKYRFYYALALKAQGKYDEALQQFQQFLQNNSDRTLQQRAQLEVEGINLALAMDEALDVEVVNAGRNINSPSQEYSPCLDSDSTFYFASLRLKEITPLKSQKDIEKNVARIYTTKRDKKNKWAKARALGDHINRAGYHTANNHISSDGNRLYFTRAKLSGDKILESKAYVSHRTASGWGPAQEISAINGDYLVRHICTGELFGKPVIFFSSNMPGGHGGFDIYYATIEGEEQYSSPVNLGDVINTPYDELTPFYLDGTLYFSSNGHPSLGGHDIFKSHWDGVQWSQPENLGAPFNSPVDDIYFFTTPDNRFTALVSNRIGTMHRSLKSKTCCDDIWFVHKKPLLIKLLVHVQDTTSKPLSNAAVELYDLSSEDNAPITKNTGKKNTAAFPLERDKAYRVIVKRKGYFPAELQLNTVDIRKPTTIEKTVTLRKKPAEVQIITINEPIRLNNIYYDFDDWKILPEAEKDLQDLLELMKKYPDMVIELSSHTDSRGSKAYNLRLSQKRAQAAKDWLVKRGIAPDRIKAVGYGEEKILNDCVDGVTCSEEEHRFNRRTEFKIIKGPTTITVKKKIGRKR